MDFADPALRADRPRDVLAGRAVIVIRSFSKIYGLAGLRLGYAISDPEVARLLDLVQEPFNVNRAALAAGLAGVSDAGFVAHRRAQVVAARELLSSRARSRRPACASVTVQLRAGRARRRRRGRRRRAHAPRHPHPRRARVRTARVRARDRGARGRDAPHRGRDRDGGAQCLSSSPTASSSCCSARAPRQSSASRRTACSTPPRWSGMRPIITRTERVAVNIADGFARATNGERFVPCVDAVRPGRRGGLRRGRAGLRRPQPDPAAPGRARCRTCRAPRGRSCAASSPTRPITRFAATLNEAARGPEIFRRALGALRGPRNGPVLVAVANDVLNGARGRGRLERADVAAASDAGERRRRRARPRRALLAAAHPVILAGQGVLYAGATAELVRLAELTGTPVATTLNGKSAFPENHPLALGTAGRTRPATVDASSSRPTSCSASARASRARSTSRPMPSRATLGQITDDRRDLATGYDIAFGCVGDARLVLLQLLDDVGAGERRAARGDRERGGRRARGLHGGVAAAADLGGLAAQPLPRRLGADAAGRPDAHRRHARCRPPARPDRALLRDDRAARLSRLGQVDPARHRPRARDRGTARASPTGCPSTSWATPPSAWSAWTSRRPSAVVCRCSRSCSTTG